MLTQGILHIKDPIWNLAVEGILVRLVDADTKVHEEVLRLLLLAAGPAGSAQLEAKDVARLLTITLANSQQSREAYANRNAELAALPPFPWGGEGLGGYDDEMVDEERYSYYGQTGLSIAAEERGADGVRGTYALFVKHVPGLNAELAPELFAYLQG